LSANRRTILLITLILLAGIQHFQTYLDSVLNELSRALPAEGLAVFALLTFALVFLLPIIRRSTHFGVVIVVGLLALRLAVQITSLPILLLVLSTFGVVLWMWFITSTLGPQLLIALPLAFFLDTLTRSLVWFDQIAYLRTPIAMILVIGLCGLALWLFLLEKDRFLITPAEISEPSLLSLLPFAGLGSVLYLGMMVVSDPTRLLSVMPGLSVPLAYFLVNLLVMLGCIVTLLPVRFILLRKWYVVLLTGILLVGSLQAMVANAPFGWLWMGLACLLTWFFSACLLSANPIPSQRGFWRSSLAVFIAFLVLLVTYFLVEKMSVHIAIPIGGGLLALAALADSFRVNRSPQPLLANSTLQMVGLILGLGIALVGVWAFQSRPTGVDGTPLTPVFINGSEGYACFRIPAIVRARDGSLIAFAEARQANCGDAGGVIRIVSRRSTDNGNTWGPIQLVGQNLQPDGSEGMAASPSPVVDLMDPANPQGVIILLFNKTENSEFDVAAGIGTRRVFATHSLDQGVTWSKPVDISAQVMRDDWRQQVPAVGHAIQLRSGRLFYTAHVTVGDSSVYESQNYVFWSDDHGKTWIIGGLNPVRGHNESMAVELEDGSVMVNARAYESNAPVGLRAVMAYPFDAQGNIQITAGRFDEHLVTPTVASSIIRYRWARDGGSILLFSGPDHPRLRINMTVRLSSDEGQTWLPGRVIDQGPSAYSDLVVQQDGLIGLLYERGNDGGIYYASFSLDWLVTNP
jgi:sialidase-1